MMALPLAPVVYGLALWSVLAAPSGTVKSVSVWLAGGFSVILAIAVGSTWWWWGVGFDEAELLGMATAKTDRAMMLSFYVATTAYVAVVVVGTAACMGRVRSLLRT